MRLQGLLLRPAIQRDLQHPEGAIRRHQGRTEPAINPGAAHSELRRQRLHQRHPRGPAHAAERVEVVCQTVVLHYACVRGPDAGRGGSAAIGDRSQRGRPAPRGRPSGRPDQGLARQSVKRAGIVGRSPVEPPPGPVPRPSAVAERAAPARRRRARTDLAKPGGPGHGQEARRRLVRRPSASGRPAGGASRDGPSDPRLSGVRCSSSPGSISSMPNSKSLS